MPVLSDLVVIFVSSTVILTPNGNVLAVPVMYSVRDIWLIIDTKP